MLLPTKNIRSLLQHLIFSPAGKAIITTATCWLLAFQYCRLRYWREPHSAFFQSEHVYDLHYSQYREEQANGFIERAMDMNGMLGKSSAYPEICAAFVTVRREGYVDAGVGSMLEGLTDEERSMLYAESTMDHLREWEEQRNFYAKGVFDYLYALDFCYNTNALYIAMFEDDIILADGWMAKTRQALREIEEHAGTKEDKFWDWVYLRLFYTETAVAWSNTDFMYRNIVFIFGTAIAAGYLLLILTRCFIPRTRRYLDNWAVAVLCLVTIPAFVTLAYMVGKNSLYPGNGVFKMNSHGCCTQALVFPRGQVPELSTYLKEIGSGQTDTMIETYSDERGKQRLALRPQLAQHVGLQSSRDNSFVNSQSTWAFWFEENDPDTLRKEHEALTKDMKD